MRRAIHHSMLAMLSKCGMQAYYRYVEGKRMPPGVAMIVGTAVHRACELDLVRKMDTGAGAPREEVEQKAAEALDATWSGEEPLLDDEEKARGAATIKAEAKDDAVRLSALHNLEMTPKLKPIGVERRMRLELVGFPFNLEGTIDVEEENTIRDRKTSSKSPTGNEADGNVQLDLYAMMRETIDKKPVAHVALDFLVKTKTPKAVTVSAPAPKSHDATLRRIEAAAKVFETGAFYPVDPTGPSGWVCSAKWCGYWDSCPFGRARRRQV